MNAVVSRLAPLSGLVWLLAACSPDSLETPPGDTQSGDLSAVETVAGGEVLTAEQALAPDDALQEVVSGEWRSEADRARDAHRHPAESLRFWGLRPGMSILEVQPGGGWWTEILAPYAKRTGGSFHATAVDLKDPQTGEGARQGRERWAARWAANPERYGQVKLLDWGPNSAPLPAESFDFVLVARSIHGWIRRGEADKHLADLYGALKPGGVLAVEQHRADPGDQKLPPDDGYVTEAYVIDLATKAGFELAESSDINANPKDTKDHPFGVWTLPPTRRTRPYDEGPDAQDPNFDRTPYDAIGESDRMTLRFQKPMAVQPTEALGPMDAEPETTPTE